MHTYCPVAVSAKLLQRGGNLLIRLVPRPGSPNGLEPASHLLADLPGERRVGGGPHPRLAVIGQETVCLDFFQFTRRPEAAGPEDEERPTQQPGQAENWIADEPAGDGAPVGKDEAE